MQISDEAVEAAANAMSVEQIDHRLDELNDHMRNKYVAEARAALKAALPHLIASQGCGTGHSADAGTLPALARSEDEYWSVSVSFNGENILTIGQSKHSGDLSGIPNIEEYADVVRAASTHLASFIGPDEPATCFICGGDCASANPPVIDCPMRSPLDGGEAVHSPDEREGSRDEPKTDEYEGCGRCVYCTDLGAHELCRGYDLPNPTKEA